MSFNKTYFEIYAALVLSHIAYLGEKFHVDWIQEKPDIQYQNIGVEVTRAISQRDAQEISCLNKLSGVPFAQRTKELERIDPKRKSTSWETKNKNMIWTPFQAPNILSEMVSIKNEKLIHYENFETQSLFIHSSISEYGKVMEEIIYREIEKVDHQFKTIFIMNDHEFFTWANRTVKSRIFTGDERSFFKEEAKKINRKYFDRHGNRR